MAQEEQGWEIYASVQPNEYLRQGDLLVFPSSDDLRKYGLVVTADCDLKNRKHGRLVTLVPVLTPRSIVEQYLLLEQCDKQREQINRKAFAAFGIDGDLGDPLVEAELRAELAIKSTLPEWRAACLAARVLLQEVDILTSKEYIELMIFVGINTGKIAERLENQLKSKGDIVVLPKLSEPQIDSTIAWVRWIWQVPMRETTLRNSEVKGNVGQRVARLSSPYRYRVTQCMAQVFSDIGTPDVQVSFANDINSLFVE